MSDATATYTAPLCIAYTHPALAGHFPGNPIVPGVVLLDQVQQAAQQWLGGRVSVRSLPQAKFAAALLPDQQAQIQLRLQGSELRFTILREQEVIAQGIMAISIGAGPERSQ